LRELTSVDKFLFGMRLSSQSPFQNWFGERVQKLSMPLALGQQGVRGTFDGEFYERQIYSGVQKFRRANLQVMQVRRNYVLGERCVVRRSVWGYEQKVGLLSDEIFGGAGSLLFRKTIRYSLLTIHCRLGSVGVLPSHFPVPCLVSLVLLRIGTQLLLHQLGLKFVAKFVLGLANSV